MRINNYIKITDYDNFEIVGIVHGAIKKDSLVELYDSLNNPLGIYSHVDSINIYGIEYDEVSHGITARFICPGLSADLLDKGMKVVVSEE